jgi:hypothetical protein
MSQFLLYIDPGSGSMILQVIAGGVLAGVLFVKNYWLRIKAYFRKDKPDENTNV